LYALAQSFLFGHIKSYFVKNKVISSSFLGHKNGPSHQELKMATFLMKKSSRMWQYWLKRRD